MSGIDIQGRRRADAFLQAPQASWSEPEFKSLRQRRVAVMVAKYMLPVFAVALLSSIALWPEISRTLENGRVTLRNLAMINRSTGQMLQPRYRGLDGRQRPYTVSADAAARHGPERLDLTAPVGDVTLANGTWLLMRAKRGVFIQRMNELDLENAVTLYRQDGTTMTSETATMNLKQGAATSNDFTHAEGPFGTLDAQGFTLVDKGSVIQFQGPAKLVMNGAH
jgi:lipopolysaccharide export system protein LptC